MVLLTFLLIVIASISFIAVHENALIISPAASFSIRLSPLLIFAVVGEDVDGRVIDVSALSTPFLMHR